VRITKHTSGQQQMLCAPSTVSRRLQQLSGHDRTLTSSYVNCSLTNTSTQSPRHPRVQSTFLSIAHTVPTRSVMTLKLEINLYWRNSKWTMIHNRRPKLHQRTHCQEHAAQLSYLRILRPAAGGYWLMALLSPDWNPRDFAEWRQHSLGSIKLQLQYGLRDRTNRTGSHLGVCTVISNAKIMRIFSLWNKRKEITGEWRKTHDEELHNSYCSPNVSGMIKWWWTGMATFVARMGEKRDGVLVVGELEERDHVEDLDVNGRKTLNGC